MKHNVIEINGGTMTNADMSVKNIYIWQRVCLES